MTKTQTQILNDLPEQLNDTVQLLLHQPADVSIRDLVISQIERIARFDEIMRKAAITRDFISQVMIALRTSERLSMAKRLASDCGFSGDEGYRKACEKHGEKAGSVTGKRFNKRTKKETEVIFAPAEEINLEYITEKVVVETFQVYLNEVGLGTEEHSRALLDYCEAMGYVKSRIGLYSLEFRYVPEGQTKAPSAPKVQRQLPQISIAKN